jgi:6-phosphofructokinase 1
LAIDYTGIVVQSMKDAAVSNRTMTTTTLLVSLGAAGGAVLLLWTSLTAYAAYTWTKRCEEAKQRAIVVRQYQREKMLKEKTAAARKIAKNEPESGGTLLEDVTIARVYLWECDDLRKLFPSSGLPNTMKFPPSATPSVRSPILRMSNVPSTVCLPELVSNCTTGNSSNSSNMVDERTTTAQAYNKLITDHECILADIVRKPNSLINYTVSYMRAGPRRTLHFDPATVSAAIVTCGGLCPGLNNVIREITNTLFQLYGIGGKVYGIQGGFQGFVLDKEPSSSWSSHGGPRVLRPIELTPAMVENIHHEGGTCLGSSRGGFDLERILDFLHAKRINQLYVIGGDGTHRGAFAIHEGCMGRGYNISVAGIPKTIDNDVEYIDQSFGFGSAVEAACLSIRSAKTEAVCNLPNGIGIVKLMGRSAGFIAAHATMASSDVDLCLVPEVPVVLEGPDGCLPHLMRRVAERGFAVVVVAEGAGEELLGTSTEKDASGNKLLPKIGEFMKDEITNFFQKHGQEATVKYIDPSYTVRSVAANASDSLYCMQLAQNAVHGAMAGYTGFTVGLCNNRMSLLPIPQVVAASPRSMDPHGRTWERVLALTRQPNTVPPKADSGGATSSLSLGPDSYDPPGLR